MANKSKILQFPTSVVRRLRNQINLESLEELLESSNLDEMALMDSICTVFKTVKANESINEVSILITDKINEMINLNKIKSFIEIVNSKHIKINYICGITEEEAKEYKEYMLRNNPKVLVLITVELSDYMHHVLGTGDGMKSHLLERVKILQEN